MPSLDVLVVWVVLFTCIHFAIVEEYPMTELDLIYSVHVIHTYVHT